MQTVGIKCHFHKGRIARKIHVGQVVAIAVELGELREELYALDARHALAVKNQCGNIQVFRCQPVTLSNAEFF